MTYVKQEDYAFESLREKKDSEFDNQQMIKKEKIKKGLPLLTIIIAVSIFLGLRWRYSIGGKLILINLFLNVIPYKIIFRMKNEKPSKIIRMYLIAATLLSFSVASYGFLTQSTGKLTFRDSIDLPQNSQYQLEIHSQRFGNTIPKLNIRSSNENVVSIPKWAQYLDVKEVGSSRIKVFDDYGNKMEFEVTSTLSVPDTIYSLGSSVIKRGDKSRITYSASDNQQLDIEMVENPYVSLSEFYYFGIQEGTVPYTVKHFNYPHFQREFTVISEDDYTINLCENTLCEVFSVGDKIDVQPLIPIEAKNVFITSDSSIFKQTGNDITAIKPGLGFITISYDDISYVLEIQVRKSNLDSVIVSDFDGSLMKINQKRNLGIKLSPSYTRFESIEYTSSNPSVALVDSEGNITPIQNGYTFIDVSIDDISVTIPVKVEL